MLASLRLTRRAFLDARARAEKLKLSSWVDSVLAARAAVAKEGGGGGGDCGGRANGGAGGGRP